MKNIIVIAILVLLLAFAFRYLIKKKKSGAACIGCPHSNSCSKCHCSENENS